MNFKKVLTALATLAAFVGCANAELVATPLVGDVRLVQFKYDENNTFLILAKPKAVTDIQFGADEVIMSVAAGDTNDWELTPTKTKKHLFVKPKYEDIDTSMTVITDKRSYQITLKSTGDQRKWYQRVSWVYSSEMLLEVDALINQGAAQSIVPINQTGQQAQGRPVNQVTPSSPMGPGGQGYMGDSPFAGAPVQNQIQKQGPTSQSYVDLSGLSGVQPENLRFNYEFEGEAPFRPVMAFDDGKFTYLKLPPNVQEMPALFAVIDGTDYALVNYTVRGEYMVAQRLLDVCVLKLGKAEVRVKKKVTKSFFSFGSD